MLSFYTAASDETLIAMLQAITIYILLRIFDEDAFGVDYDQQLVGAMTVRQILLSNPTHYLALSRVESSKKQRDETDELE